ncbi:MAG: LptF/LptG family permease, partial [candidate division KSB1 bacterium]
MSKHILSRYILREHVGPFSFSLSVITLIFLLDLLFRSLNRILSKGLHWTVVLEFLGLNLAWIVATAVPMAVLTATLMTFGRLAADNEIAAMQACGINLWRQVLPVFLAAALLAVGLIWFNDNILPDCNLRVRTLAADIVRRKPTVQIEPGIWYNEIPNYGLLAQSLEDSAGLTKARHLLIDDNSRAEVRRTISARAGLIQANTVEAAFLLTLFDGEIQELNLLKGEEFRRVTFSKHIMAIGAKENTLSESELQTRTDREKSTKQMWEEVGAVHAQIALLREQLKHLEKQPSLARWREEKIATIFQFEADVQALLVEIHKKYAIPAACLVFVVVGAPLGALARRGGIATGAGLSLGFFLFYWAGLIGGEALADRRMLSPVFAMWSANLVTGVLGVFVFRYVATGKLVPRSFALFALMRAFFSKAFWQRKSMKPSRRKKNSSFDFKLLDDELAEFSKEHGLAKSDEAGKTGDFKLLEHELAEFSKELGITKSDEAEEAGDFELAEPELADFSQERGLTKLDEAVETEVEYEILTFDVVEPEFIHQLQA